MKNPLTLFATLAMLAGAWISIYGMMINDSGVGISISGAVIFGASLVSLAILSKNSNR